MNRPARWSRPALWAVVMALGVMGPAVAQPIDWLPYGRWCALPRLGASWRARRGWCPDDYCRKSMPCVSHLPNSCLPDDYGRKSLPAVACPPRGCVDDYDRKCGPVLIGVGAGPHDTCGAACSRGSREKTPSHASASHE